MDLLRIKIIVSAVPSMILKTHQKLVDVLEMNYASDDQPHPHREICVRGHIGTLDCGYPEEALRLLTGMPKYLLRNSTSILKKNIIKLAQGEYITPDKIKNVYAKCRFISHSFIYGKDNDFDNIYKHHFASVNNVIQMY
uniref:Uncharacterized protein n=1 Tax=Lactuca sativa TaxID=4236 RepID=A0A9R1WRT0_LACSA|nr:hypothetical protein LSAT_V11C900500690 [Lactuca sativa]